MANYFWMHFPWKPSWYTEVVVKQAGWIGPGAAPDHSPEAYPKRHIWQGTWSHSGANPNRGKNTLTPLPFRWSFPGAAVQDHSLALWPATGVLQEHSLPQNQTVTVWMVTFGSGAIGGGACAHSQSLLLGALHFWPPPDRSGSGHLITARRQLWLDDKKPMMQHTFKRQSCHKSGGEALSGFAFLPLESFAVLPFLLS